MDQELRIVVPLKAPADAVNVYLNKRRLESVAARLDEGPQEGEADYEVRRQRVAFFVHRDRGERLGIGTCICQLLHHHFGA